MSASSAIGDRILASILARRLAPGSRLGEGQLAAVFACSRTVVREALFTLAARGIVEVSPRRGWYVIEPSRTQAREAFEARLVVETGLLRRAQCPGPAALEKLRGHVERQRQAVAGRDIGLRSFLLGDFHVQLAHALGNALLAETVRDLTIRTTLAAMNHQPDADAARSCAEHAGIVAALGDSDLGEAERRMAAHLGSWESKLPLPEAQEALARLQAALAPLD
jgi:DNA-binding GntR family transcriptional regulator